MKQLIQIFHILLFYALGEVAAILMGEFVPGSVLGMVFLFLALLSGLVKADKVQGAAQFLTSNMGLFFVPAGVGLMKQVDVLQRYWLIIVVAMIISTILVIGVVAKTQEHMEHLNRKRHKDHNTSN